MTKARQEADVLKADAQRVINEGARQGRGGAQD